MQKPHDTGRQKAIAKADTCNKHFASWINQETRSREKGRRKNDERGKRKIALELWVLF